RDRSLRGAVGAERAADDEPETLVGVRPEVGHRLGGIAGVVVDDDLDLVPGDAAVGVDPLRGGGVALRLAAEYGNRARLLARRADDDRSRQTITHLGLPRALARGAHATHGDEGQHESQHPGERYRSTHRLSFRSRHQTPQCERSGMSTAYRTTVSRGGDDRSVSGDPGPVEEQVRAAPWRDRIARKLENLDPGPLTRRS